MKTLRTLGSGPSSDLAGKLDSNNLRALQLPRQVGHNIDSVGTSDTDCNHAETTSIRGMRVGSDHKTTGESVVLEDDLVDDTRAGLPETDAVLGLCILCQTCSTVTLLRQTYSASSKEVVHLPVELVGTGKIFLSTGLSLNKMVAVHLQGCECKSPLLARFSFTPHTEVGTAAVGRPAVMNCRSAI